ncbi:MAG: helix-turn-helix transcriptional regulator [Clostridia bacterium]
MKLSEAFAIRLNELLSIKGESVYKFCKTNGIGRSTIVNLISGDTKSPTLSTIYQVSNALDISPLEFLNCNAFKREDIEYD